MLYFYIVAAAVATLLADIPFDIFRESYSWWAVPLIFAGLFILFILLHILAVFLSAVFVNTEKPVGRENRFYYKLLISLLNIAFKLGRVHIHTEGAEKVPQNERFLLVANHLHDFDPAVIMNELPDTQFAFIAKKEVFTTLPLVGKIIHKLHGLPIDRENNREAAKTIIKAIHLIKDDVASVGIFPEGYTSKDGNLQPLRNGSLKIATKASSKIVVCVLTGTREIVHNMFRRKCDVYLDIIDVIDTSDGANTATIGDRIHEEMAAAIEKRKNEIK